MAYKRINDPYVRGCMKEYIVDTDADFAKLPTACAGSMAVSLESGKVYVVSTFGNWIPFGEGYVEKEPSENLGTWVFNDEISMYEGEEDTFIATTSSADYPTISVGLIKVGPYGPPGVKALQYVLDESTAISVYVYEAENMYGAVPGWSEEGYKTVTITNASENVMAWLKANATKVG